MNRLPKTEHQAPVSETGVCATAHKASVANRPVGPRYRRGGQEPTTHDSGQGRYTAAHGSDRGANPTTWVGQPGRSSQGRHPVSADIPQVAGVHNRSSAVRQIVGS